MGTFFCCRIQFSPQIRFPSSPRSDWRRRLTYLCSFMHPSATRKSIFPVSEIASNIITFFLPTARLEKDLSGRAGKKTQSYWYLSGPTSLDFNYFHHRTIWTSIPGFRFQISWSFIHHAKSENNQRKITVDKQEIKFDLKSTENTSLRK